MKWPSVCRREWCQLIFPAAIILLAPDASLAFSLPDTGQTKGSQAVAPSAEVPCAGTGQDGEYSINPLSFTDNGDGTVTDDNTGLMWQQEDDGATHNWYQASGTDNSFYNPGGENVCGSLSLGDHSDWRLPTRKELMGLVDYAIPWPGPAIQPVFTNTKSSEYWSSTASAGIPSQAWYVLFDNGLVDYNPKGDSSYVRCVRGAHDTGPVLTDNGDGTVTDARTALVWQQAEPGPMTWGAALSYCGGLTLGERSDWRLPEVTELASLVDDTRWSPAIDTTLFPGASSSYSWSATPYAGNPSYAWVVYFHDGYVYPASQYDYSFNVRCVHSGESIPAWRSGEADLGGGWKWTDWFGLYNTTYDPWVYHLQHGWLYAYDDGSGGVFFWYHDLQKFVWTTPTTYPVLYRWGGGDTWLWYLKDSSNPRLFYNYGTGQWESL